MTQFSTWSPYAITVPSVTGTKGKNIPNYSCLTSIGISLWFSSSLSWSLCLHVCRLQHAVGSVSKIGTFCLGQQMDILKLKSKPLQKVLSKPNVLNPMFSTLTYHVTDPHQVLALFNQTISSPFILYPCWKHILTGAENLVHCISHLSDSNLQFQFQLPY